MPTEFPHQGIQKHHLNNLPVQLTSFIGRERELSEVKRLLATARLLTLIGPGGCGKTRLALQTAVELDAAQAFTAGVCWVDLAALNDSALVPQAVARALGVREAPRQPLTETLSNYLQPKHLLLLLDNCEHLRAACAELIQMLLLAAPDLQVLSTSREPLGIAGETTWLVPSLSLPDAKHLPQSISNLTQYDAIQLFVERARSVLPTFALTDTNAAAIVQICQRLDGIPLAIELAAARVNVLTAQQIAARLDDCFALLTTGSRTALIPRHHTLRATIEWSHDLLSEKERLLFRQLSMFAGGFTLEAVETICAGDGLERGEVLDGLSQLVDKSLVVAETEGRREARYRLLETIQQYAREKLAEVDEKEKEDVKRRYLEFFLQFAEQTGSKLKSGEQLAWLNHLETEHDNLRAAIKWSLQSGEALTALRLAGALFRFWHIRGYHSEAQERLQHVLVRSEAVEADPTARATVLNALGFIYVAQSNDSAAGPLLEEALALASASGDKHNTAWSLHILACVALNQADYAAVHSFSERALNLWCELSDDWGSANSLNYLGEAALSQGDYEEAQTRYEEAATLLRQLQDRDLLALPLRRLGQLALRRSDYDRAIALCQESLMLNVEVGDRQAVAACLAGLAGVATTWAQSRQAQLREETLRRAARLFGVTEALLQIVRVPLWYTDRVEYERNVATVRAQLGDETYAAAWAEGHALTLEQGIAEAQSLASRVKSESEPVQPPTPSPEPLALAEPLNEREREVLRLMADGLSNHEIADRLVLAVSTVKWHVGNLFGKLGVHSRTQAVARAKELGLL